MKKFILFNSSKINEEDIIDLDLYQYQKSFGLSYRQAIKDPYEKIILNLSLLRYHKEKKAREQKAQQDKLKNKRK